jgi:hypothetical protein
MPVVLDELGDCLVLGDLLAKVASRFGSYELVAHWTQGEFHHDLVLRIADCVLVVSTNCNGGVKEVLALDEVPERGALWTYRCGLDPAIERSLLGSTRTLHWFNPCELLGDDARSELLPEHRQRQCGGGWELKK